VANYLWYRCASYLHVNCQPPAVRRANETKHPDSANETWILAKLKLLVQSSSISSASSSRRVASTRRVIDRLNHTIQVAQNSNWKQPSARKLSQLPITLQNRPHTSIFDRRHCHHDVFGSVRDIPSRRWAETQRSFGHPCVAPFYHWVSQAFKGRIAILFAGNIIQSIDTQLAIRIQCARLWVDVVASLLVPTQSMYIVCNKFQRGARFTFRNTQVDANPLCGWVGWSALGAGAVWAPMECSPANSQV
jgi:hypothetical protein